MCNLYYILCIAQQSVNKVISSQIAHNLYTQTCTCIGNKSVLMDKKFLCFCGFVINLKHLSVVSMRADHLPQKISPAKFIPLTICVYVCMYKAI